MNKESILKIFSKLGFAISKDNDLGDVIEMEAKDAFIFSSIIGSPYLIYPYGVIMKGRCEVFIHRSVFSDGYYTYTPGLFNRDKKGNLTEGNSADILLKKYPSVFKNKKYIYIHDIKVDCLSNIESEIFDFIKSKGKNTEDFILYKNFISGASTEPLFEYLSSLIYIKEGYLTENQVPWFQQNLKYDNKTLQGGIPDFSAFHCELSSYLESIGIINSNYGAVLNLLPVIKNFQKIKLYDKKTKKTIKTTKYKLIIGEVKYSKLSLPGALHQLKKYKEVNLVNELYTIIPDVKDNLNDYIGEIYLDNNGLNINKSNYDIEIDNKRQQIDNDWINVYIKMLLLGNLSFPKIIELIESHRKNKGLPLFTSYEAAHLLDAIECSDNDSYFNYLTSNIIYGIH